MATNVSHKQLLGRRVVSQDGRVLGEVVNLIVDPSSWHVVQVGVRLWRDVLEPLGLHKPWFGSPTVQVRVADIAGLSDAVVLRLHLDEFRFAVQGGAVRADVQPPAPPPA